MIYRPEIDGLRAFAVLPVILFHAGFSFFSGGYVGVDVFFVISGYLITTIIIDQLAIGEFSLAKFYERRARRILPVLFFIVTLCIPFAWFWLLPREMLDFSQSTVAVMTFSSNILFWIESGYFQATSELKPLLHTWSLAVEEQYYIIFPLLLMLIWGLRKTTVVAVLLTTLIVSLAAAHHGAYSDPRSTFFLLTTRGWELLVGVLVAFYLQRRTRIPSPELLQSGSLIGLALLAISIFTFDEQTPFPSLYALVPTLGTAMIILFATNGTIVYRLLSTRGLVGIGLISYSAYLWHQPLLAFAKYRSPSEPPAFLIVALVVATFPLAFLSYRYVETPFRRKNQVLTKPFLICCVIYGLALASFGAWGHKSQGFPNRFEGRYSGIVAAVAEQFNSSFLYVSKRWKETLVLRDFDIDPTTKNVLIIGDSFGMDVANAIYDSDLDSAYFLSTYHISRICGNVWTDRDLNTHIAPDERERCNTHERYSEPQLIDLMNAADEVWLVSSWQDWHLDYLPETIQRISESSSAKLRVFGRKNFGRGLSFYHYLEATKNGIDPYAIHLPDDHILVNDMMMKSIDSETFVDVSGLLCGYSNTCINGTPEGLLISYDGNHLTREGAAFLGVKLRPILDSP